MNRILKLVIVGGLLSTSVKAMEGKRTDIDVTDTPFFKVHNKTGQDDYSVVVPSLEEGRYSDFRVRVVFDQGRGLAFINDHYGMLNKNEVPVDAKGFSSLAPVSTIEGGIAEPQTQFITAYVTCTGSCLIDGQLVNKSLFLGEVQLDLKKNKHVKDVVVNFKGVSKSKDGDFTPNISFVIDQVNYEKSNTGRVKKTSVTYLRPLQKAE